MEEEARELEREERELEGEDWKPRGKAVGREDFTQNSGLCSYFGSHAERSRSNAGLPVLEGKI
jgi:hypothetical protein